MRAIMTGLLSAAVFSTVLMQTAAGANSQPALPQPAASAPAIPLPRDVSYPGHIAVAVDTANIAQGIFAVHETIPVTRGARLALLYPEWRPGNHSPTGRGRLARVAGLVITADGKPLAWSRDPVNVFAVHVSVPSRVTSIDVDFQYLPPPASDYGRPETTLRILTLDWDAVTFYPAGYYARQITVDARLTIPGSWPRRSSASLSRATRCGLVRRRSRPWSTRRYMPAPT